MAKKADKENQNVITAPIIIAVVIGLGMGFLLARIRYKPQINTLYKMVKERDKAKLHMMPDGQMMKSGASMGMNEMVKALEGKKGDEFDKTFISLMIEHHQGAIDMAKLGETYAKHDELKILSENIILTQTQEITDMKNWWQLWGYKK